MEQVGIISFGGLYFGIILVLEKLFISRLLDKLPSIIKHLYAIILIIIGWVIFRVENFDTLKLFLLNMFNFSKSDFLSLVSSNISIVYVWPYIIIGIIGSIPLFGNLLNKLNNSNKIYIQIIYDLFILSIFILTIIYLISSSYNPFIYFRF